MAGRSSRSLERTLNEAAEFEQHLYRLEERLLEPATRSSSKEVADLLAEDFVEFGSSGVAYDRASVIAGLAQEKPIQRSIANFKATPLAEGVVLVTYILTKAGGGSSLRSSIWKLSGGRWRMSFHQGTVAKG